MPRATNNTQDTTRKELKTVPGGFVVLRRLSYGEKVQRRAMTSAMRFEANNKSKDFAGEMRLVNEQATLFDFQRCIVEHNLQKPNPTDPDNAEADLPIDFSNINDIKSLDPRTGEEIDTYMDELNNFEDDEGN